MAYHTSNGLPEHGGSDGAERNGSPRPEVTSSQAADTGLLANGNGAERRHDGGVTRDLTPRKSRVAVAASGQNDTGKSSPRILVISGAALTIVLSLAMSLNILPGQVEIKAGMPASQDILSPTYLNYASKVLTEKAREKEMQDPANQV